MKKRIVCMGLVLLLLLSCVSCGKKDVADNGNPNTNVTENNPVTPPTETLTEPDEPGPVLEENPRIAEIEAEALARKQELLAKPEELKQSDELILGKTYTGTAYYLSNKGDDANDGLSPESPKASWESLKGKLKSGDAVLFECGSEWRIKFTKTGNVNYDICRDRWTIPNGVTLSSYGDGDRPMIRGDIAQEEVMNPDKWESFYDENGVKIWHYTDKINKPNVIVFDNGASEAEIIMNCLNKDGKAINKEGMELSIESLLEDNLTFAHLPDVNGVKNWKPDDTWAMGDLYLRCDEGNPAQIHQEICIPQVEIGLCIRDIGAIENLNTSYFTYSGIELDDYGTLTHENITKNKVVENCIVKYCGGVAVYEIVYYNGKVYEPRITGGGIQTSGKNISVHDNYLYSCGPFSLIISGHWYSSERKKMAVYSGIYETDNYFECCGPAFHWAALGERDGGGTIFSDIIFSGNYVMNTGEGRLRRAIDDGDGTFYGMGSAVENIFGSAENEDIKVENNVFFLSRQPLIFLNSYNHVDNSPLPKRIEPGAVFSGNTYVQFADTPFLLTNQNWDNPEEYPLCIPQVEIGLYIRDVGVIENLNVCYFIYDGIRLDDYGLTTREDNVNNKVVENCILKYCGGGVSYSGPYEQNVYEPHVSGGAIQISGRNISVHDNYFYSCGLFTVTLVAQYYSSEQGKKVIHDSIHVTDNYMEYCGPAVHWANLTAKNGATCVFSDIVFSSNYAMYTCSGRLERTMDYGDSNFYGFGVAVDNKFGSADNEDIRVENNVFFCSRQPLVSINAYRYTSDYIERCETSAVFSGNTYVQYSDTPFLLTNQDNNDPERNYTEWYRIYGKDYLKDFLGDDTGEYIEYPVYSEKDRAYLNGLVSYDIWLNDDNAEVSYTEYRDALIGLIQRVNPDKVSYFEEKVTPIETDVSINRVMAFFMSFYAAHAMEIDYVNVFGWSFRHEEAPFTTAENIFPTIWSELDEPIITKWVEEHTDCDAAYLWLLSCGSPVTAHPIIDFDENGQFHDADLFTNVDACNALTRLYESKTRTRETSK